MSPLLLFQTAPRRLQRLREMSLAEVATRARQKASSWLERAMAPPVWTAPERVLQQHAPALADVEAVARFRDDITVRFFPGAVRPDTPETMRSRFSGASSEILAAADRVCHGRFDLLGYELLSFGDPVDWHWDPVADQRAPICHWSLIDPLDTSVVGDSKVVWELNRHQWLVTLAQAYLLSGDVRYVNAAGELVDAWLEANPPGIGVNWTSSLEVSYRLIAWCWAMALLRDSVFLVPDRFARLTAAIWAHARHVERYLSVYFSPNTHLTGEALGLFYAGVVFPQFADAPRWRVTGKHILTTEIDRQILPDGVNFEQASCYHRYTLEIYLHLAILAAQNDVALAPSIQAGIQRASEFLHVMAPEGVMPRIGDEDGGWLLPLVRRVPDDARGVLGVSSALLHQPALASPAAGVAEVLWLLGANALDRVESNASAEAPCSSQAFRAGGYVVMSQSTPEGSCRLVFDVGPLGCPTSSGHGHADLLSIQCDAFGDAYVVDPGTYCYTPEPTWRDYFRSTAAHSTVTVDGRSQADPVGPFAWHDRPSARLRSWHQTPLFDLADADHDAYSRLPDPVRHRRRILFVKTGYWIVVDDLLAAREHTVDVRFQLSPRGVVKAAAPWYLATGTHGGGLWIGAFADAPLERAVHAGDVDPIEGWISTHYGRRRPAPAIVYRAQTRLPLRVVSVLWPVRTVAAVPEIFVRRQQHAFVLAIAPTGDTVTVDDETLRLER